MTNDFKGVRGGDPSLKPALVWISLTCVCCGNEYEKQIREGRAYEGSECCSTQCENIELVKRFHEVINSKGYGDMLPTGVSAGFAKRYLKRHNLLVLLNQKPSLVRNGMFANHLFACEQCGKVTERVYEAKSAAAPRYCSNHCQGSAKLGFPVGVVCRSYSKAIVKDTLEAMEAELVRVNRELLEAGDEEGLTPYLCSCGKWHAGHLSKAVWDAPKLALIESIEDELSRFARPLNTKKFKSIRRVRMAELGLGVFLRR